MKSQIKRALRYILHGVQPKIVTANITVSDSSQSLVGKNIVITGGGRGLGFYIAKKCVEEGANVLITGRNEQTLQEASKQLGACAYIPFDVTNIDHVKQFFIQCEKKLSGGVDCLVNNAGISLHERNIMNVTLETYDKQFATNLRAPYFLSQEFISRYDTLNKTSGSILFITSERGLYCDDIPYGLIKAAINSLTQGLGRRLIDKGIRVNAVAPGVTASDMTGYTKEGNLLRPSACGERVYLPEEVAEVACFLLSDAAGCISSQIVPCNRGNHLKCDW